MRSPVLRVGATMTRTYRLLDVRGTSAQCVTDSHKNEDGGGLQERDRHRHFNLETRMGRNTTLAEADSAVKWLDQDAITDRVLCREKQAASDGAVGWSG